MHASNEESLFYNDFYSVWGPTNKTFIWYVTPWSLTYLYDPTQHRKPRYWERQIEIHIKLFFTIQYDSNQINIKNVNRSFLL